MKFNNSVQQNVAMVNRVCMAYFLNILENLGVHIHEMQPQYNQIKQMADRYFIEPSGVVAFTKYLFTDKAIIRNREIKELDNKRINEFFDDDFKGEINKLAEHFSEVLKDFPNSDLVFTMLPDANPFANDFCCDEDTGFAARLIYGHDLMTNKGDFIFEFSALIVDKMRKVEGEDRWQIAE